MRQDNTLLMLEENAYKKVNLAICITDEDSNYVSVNDKYVELFGYEQSELIGKSFLSVVNESDAEFVMQLYRNAIVNESFEASDKVTRKIKNGDTIFVATTYRTIRINGKNYMISTVRDLSDSKEEEARQRVGQQMLVQQSRMAAMGEMISAIAHQWRQPLNALGIIIQDVKIAQRFGELNTEYIESFNEGAMAQIKLMSKTIDDFRNFFKPDAVKENFALIGAALDVVSLIGPQLEHHGIKVEVYSPLDIEEPGEALIHGYPNEFKQIVLNMLSNSKDASVEKQERDGEYEAFVHIEIGVGNHAGHRFAFMRVIDNGIGIKEEVLPRIFEPYFTTKEQGKGTGVGLYMTKMIVEQNMNGSIMAWRPKDGGAAFEIRFEEGKGVFVG